MESFSPAGGGMGDSDAAVAAAIFSSEGKGGNVPAVRSESGGPLQFPSVVNPAIKVGSAWVPELALGIPSATVRPNFTSKFIVLWNESGCQRGADYFLL